MYPTYAAVLQVIPLETDDSTPEAFRCAVRAAVESWARDAASAGESDSPSPNPGELRADVLECTGSADGEIREVGALGDLPWAWQCVVRRPLPCAEFPNLQRSLVSQVQIRAAAADAWDAPHVREIGYKLQITIREHLAFPEGQRSPGRQAETAPPSSLVDLLITRFRVFQGAIQWTKSYWRVHDRISADDLCDRIIDARRAVPLVVTVGSDTADPPVEPRELGRRLFGIGRVVHIEDPRLTRRLRTRLGEVHRVGWNVIRVFHSHYQPYDTSGAHPFFRADDIASWRYGDFIDYLCNRIQRGESALVDEDVTAREAFQRVAERSVLEARQSISAALDVLRSRAGGSAVESLADDVSTIFDLYDEEQARRRTAESDRDLIARELEEARDETYRLRSKIQGLDQGNTATQQALLDGPFGLPVPATLTEALDQALDRVADGELLVVPHVRKEVEKVQGIRPVDLRDKLLMMAQVVRICRSSHGDGRGPSDYFRELGLELKADISETARQRYRSDYVVRHSDEQGEHEDLMGPHLDLSVRHRIYWFHDKANQRFIVGHIGDHLRDKSTT